MPSYKVLHKGFFGGRIFDPEGKRPVLHTETPFPSVKGVEQVPEWLQALKTETPAQASARKGAETKARKASDKKAKEDTAMISDASFMGSGESSSQVETL